MPHIYPSPFGIRFPQDLEEALKAIAKEEGKSFGALAKGSLLQVYRDRLILRMNEKRYNELVREYITERGDE